MKRLLLRVLHWLAMLSYLGLPVALLSWGFEMPAHEAASWFSLVVVAIMISEALLKGDSHG